MNPLAGRLLSTLALAFVPALLAEESPLLDLTVTGDAKTLTLPLINGVDAFEVRSATDLSQPFSPVTGSFSNYVWSVTNRHPAEFFTLLITPTPSNEIVGATILNRIAYGPTPDELDRIRQTSVQAFIDEQLNPSSIPENLAVDERTPVSKEWQHFVVTGRPTRTNLYVYLEIEGDAFIDDIRLIAGSNVVTGINRIRNGDFEQPLHTNDWVIATNLTPTRIVAGGKSGANSLQLIATSPGETSTSAMVQGVSGLTLNTPYTLSFWWKPGSNAVSSLRVRFSQNGIDAVPEKLYTRLSGGAAVLADLRDWHITHAVQAKRQLLEVLLQFLENHFVTQHRKSREYLDRYVDNDTTDRLAARMEFNEIERWRAALLNPQCTFHDLLKISAESPAMIIYLDTVDSRGDGRNIANENYARELLELFTFGVDNGYEQIDITEMSKAWTGWAVRLVQPVNELNPLTTAYDTTPGPGKIWSFIFRVSRHHTGSKTIFVNKFVPDRFGPPYAGRSYQLTLPARTDTNAIKDGYETLTHLANQPFTQEYLSVKLCRLLIHEEFHHGYDYRTDNSPEARLVRDCMRTWEESSPKGQIWKVVATILNSEMFRTQAAARQKVKTPFEFTVSAIRTLRALAPDGTYTADTSGSGLYNPMNQMGRMRLFDRDDPDGYPETAAPWISAGTLAERLRYVQALLMPTNSASGRGDITAQDFANPVRLLKLKLPSTQWRNAEAVSDFFLGLLYPGEGKVALESYRRAALEYLNTADNGTSVSAFSSLIDTTATYDIRVRGMVAMLMTFERFQEQ